MDLIEAISRATVSPDEKDGRIYGALPGMVTDTQDPKGLGRVKARIGAQQNSEETEWLDPAWPGSMEGIPEVREPVWVIFADGDPSRGIYLWHPTTTTKNRAQDFMLLGSTFVGMFNFLIDQYNQLRTDYNNLITTLINHTHAGVTTGPGTSGTSAAPFFSTSALQANKGMASDNSTVSNIATSKVVLSGRAKIK